MEGEVVLVGKPAVVEESLFTHRNKKDDGGLG